jgi:hypothetical protein
MTTAVLAGALLAGCSDSDDPADFDPTGMTADIEAIPALLEDDAASSYLGLVDDMSLAMQGAAPLVRASAMSIRAAGEPRALAGAVESIFAPLGRELSAARLPEGMSAIVIPSELLGTTFEWDTGLGEYQATDAPGAPSNGVRFVLYAVDPVDYDIVLPLVETGHVDFIDGSTASTNAVRVRVVSGSTTYVDYGVAHTPAATTDLVVVDGFITDGDERLNFDLRTTFGAGTFLLDYDLALVERDLTMSYTVDATSTTVDLEFLVRGPNGEIAFTGGGSGTVETYVFEVNGEEFATLEIDESSATWVSADGDPLTAAEEEALETSYFVTLYGFSLAQALMEPIGT